MMKLLIYWKKTGNLMGVRSSQTMRNWTVNPRRMQRRQFDPDPRMFNPDRRRFNLNRRRFNPDRRMFKREQKIQMKLLMD